MHIHTIIACTYIHWKYYTSYKKILWFQETVQIYCLLWNEFQLRLDIKFNGTIISLALHDGNKTLLVAAIRDSQSLKLHITDLFIESYNKGLYLYYWRF